MLKSSGDCRGSPICGHFPATSIFVLANDSYVGHWKFGHWKGAPLFQSPRNNYQGSAIPKHDFAKMNYWLAKYNKTGPDQGFLLDLGCSKRAVGVRLKNTHNRKSNPRTHLGDLGTNRGTKRFRLLGSTRSPDGPWQIILEANLEYRFSRKERPPPVKQLIFENPLLVRFVKFELLEFWGLGGGLQYFSIVGEDDAGNLPPKVFSKKDHLVAQMHNLNLKISQDIIFPEF